MATRSIFITGAASGIGLATARHFAERGWFVGLADIDEAGLAAASTALESDRASTHRLDVRDRAAWPLALDAFTARAGRLDVLVNNAGVARMGFLEDQSDDDVDAQIDINLKGVINGCRAGLPRLAATPGALVVNIASVAGVIAPARMSVYVATKFAVRGFSESIALEFSRLGVGVRCIMPWFLDTPLLDKAGGNADIRAMLTGQGVAIYPVEGAALAIWKAVDGKRLHHLVGAQARQAGFLSRLVPGLVRSRLRRQVSGG